MSRSPDNARIFCGPSASGKNDPGIASGNDPRAGEGGDDDVVGDEGDDGAGVCRDEVDACSDRGDVNDDGGNRLLLSNVEL